MSENPATCPVCRQNNLRIWSVAKDYEYFTLPGNFTYYKCDDCDAIFIWPQPVEQLKIIYPSNYYSFQGHHRNIVVRIKEWLDKKFFKKILSGIKDPEIAVLDIGGGTGWEMDLLKKTDSRISFTQVVDIDEKAKTIAEAKGHSYFTGTIENFVTNRQFNIILMLNLIEHVADPLAVMQKAETLLTPGGIIIIKTPNSDSWDARLFQKTYWGGLHSPRHWVIFTESSFRRLLSTTTLGIQKLSYTQGAPFWAFSIIAMLFRKKMVRISSQKPIIYHWLFAPLSAMFALFDFLRRPFAKTSQMFILLTKENRSL